MIFVIVLLYEDGGEVEVRSWKPELVEREGDCKRPLARLAGRSLGRKHRRSALQNDPRC